jgi:hypothetical protein
LLRQPEVHLALKPIDLGDFYFDPVTEFENAPGPAPNQMASKLIVLVEIVA